MSATLRPLSVLSLGVVIAATAPAAARQAPAAQSAAPKAAAPKAVPAKSFATPEEAVSALRKAVKAGDLPGLLALFGSEGKAIVDTSDPATGKRNREIFVAAAREGHRLEDKGEGRKELVVGNEGWPFPIPLVKSAAGWHWDAAAGREEVLNRRIGRNELDVIRVLQSYVAAQKAYAATGHDGKPPGLFAERFGSEPGTENGLYWPTRGGEPPSPLGVLIARANQAGYKRLKGVQGPTPLHGYYFRILKSQGPAAKGGARDYVVDGAMSGGFGLVAWPVYYGASGIMTFTVNQDGVAYEKDLGPGTEVAVKSITRFDPVPTWRPVGAAPQP